MSIDWDAFSQSLDGSLRQDHLTRAVYAQDASIYEITPDAVVIAGSTTDIQKTLVFSQKHDLPVTLRAAGTSLAGQVVNRGLILSIGSLDSVMAYNPKQHTVTVQPGIIRDDLNRWLDDRGDGLFFGPNTSTSNRCMIGGMVGNNSSGTTSIKYGVTRDKVLQISGFLADGTQLVIEPLNADQYQDKLNLQGLEGDFYRTLHDTLNTSGLADQVAQHFPHPDIHRRNTGYALDAVCDFIGYGGTEAVLNLPALLCGSEGTLFVTTEITLQLDQVMPAHSAMVVVTFGNVPDCLAAVQTCMDAGELYTCEMLDDTILNLTDGHPKYSQHRSLIPGNPAALLFCELRNDDPVQLKVDVAACIQTVQAGTSASNVFALYDQQADMALELRKAGLGLLGKMIGDRKTHPCIEDTAVRLQDLPNYIAEFTKIMQGYGQEAVYYAHAGAGELHLRPILDLTKPAEIRMMQDITTDVAHLVKRYKGSLSGEHGDGIVRGSLVPLMVGEELYQIMGKLKRAFDPAGLLNPGKIVDALPMTENLRYNSYPGDQAINTTMDFSDSAGFVQMAKACNGSGDCVKSTAAAGTMCPSYQLTKHEKDSTRGRANVLRQVMQHGPAGFDSDDVKQALDLCISCKACTRECPSGVAMATLKSEWEHHNRKRNGTSLRSRMIVSLPKLLRRAGWLAPMMNVLGNARVGKRLLGIAGDRSLPALSRKRIYNYASSQNVVEPIGSLYLFIDEFTDQMDYQVGKDCVDLLTGLGYEIKLIHHAESGRAHISKGFLNEAKVAATKNVSLFTGLVSDEVPLIGLEPSAILGFRDEYKRLVPGEATERLAANTFTFTEFLSREAQRGRISSEQFDPSVKEVRIHNHCHNKALADSYAIFNACNLPTNYHVTLLNSGCCGMAGSFGYEAEHYEASLGIGELKLFPAVRQLKEDVVIVANGTSCRHQLKDALNRQAVHPATLLLSALLPR